MALEKLLANAEYLGEKENIKKDKKSYVEKYHYFKTDVKIGNKIYEIIFDTEEYKNDKTSSESYADTRSSKLSKEDTNSITNNKENLNPKTVHLCNISEKKKNNISYQEINPEQQNIFPGNGKAKEIHKVKGGYLPADKFIELFKNADASTIVTK